MIREINEAFVLDIVRGQAPVSRAVIAAETGLSAATVTGISGRLLQAGLIIETEVVRDTGGRPARLLELGRDAVLAAGVRVSVDEAHAVLVNLRGELIAEHREAVSSTAPEDVVAATVLAVNATLRHAPAAAALLGVGVAVSGIVDQADGVVRHSGSLNWENVPLRALLRSALDVPVVLDSYVNSLAHGLLLSDGDFEGRDLLAFSVGASLGASIVVEGRIHRGFAGAAGGFAHSRTSFDPESPRACHCGAYDCLETRSSLWGIKRQLEQRGHSGGIDPRRDADLIADAATHLGVAMANVSKIFAPERVVFAYSAELDGIDFVAATVSAFRAQYVHEHAPIPEVQPIIAVPMGQARGAAYAVLAGLFTAAGVEDEPIERSV